MSCNKLKNRINDVVNSSIYSENPEFPKKGMLIEITNLCNDACIFCFNKNMVREKGFIDSKLVDKVLNEAYELGMREVGFYTTGEPLLNKNLEDYIYKAKTIGYQYVYITTNGVLADINRVKNLIEKDECGNWEVKGLPWEKLREGHVLTKEDREKFSKIYEISKFRMYTK